MTLVSDYARLFNGRKDAHGLGKDPHRGGRGGVVRIEGPWGHNLWRDVWAPLYAEHVRGEGRGLGVFPLLPDGTTHFAAIDLDEPDFEAARAMQALLPGTTWLERSHSGNAHVWAFFSTPVEAWIPRGLMRAAVAGVGRADVEIFPKQDRLLPGSLGNYINLPYHGAGRPMLTKYDTEFNLRDFVGAALESRNDPAAWERYARAMGVEDPAERSEARADFGQQANLHLCAEHILERSWVEPLTFDPPRAGEVVMFTLAKQLLNWSELSEDEAWELLSDLNDRSHPPVDEYELRRQFNNVVQRQYTSTGCDDPVFRPFAHPDCPIANGLARSGGVPF